MAVGYEVSSDLLNNYLQAETSTMVHLANLDDKSEGTTIRHTFLCCYMDYRDRIYDCEDILAGCSEHLHPYTRDYTDLD